LARENAELARQLAEAKERTATTAEEADREWLELAQIKKKMKRAKGGIKGAFGHDDDSYIEIILPINPI